MLKELVELLVGSRRVLHEVESVAWVVHCVGPVFLVFAWVADDGRVAVDGRCC